MFFSITKIDISRLIDIRASTLIPAFLFYRDYVVPVLSKKYFACHGFSGKVLPNFADEKSSSVRLPFSSNLSHNQKIFVDCPRYAFAGFISCFIRLPFYLSAFFQFSRTSKGRLTPPHCHSEFYLLAARLRKTKKHTVLVKVIFFFFVKKLYANVLIISASISSISLYSVM